MNKFARVVGSSKKALATVAVFGMTVMQAAHAQASGSGIDAALDAVDLSGIAVKIAAAGLLIVGIALAFKGPDLSKRVVRKV